MKPTVIDLFCGAGGLTLGFRAAGFKVAFAAENDEHARKTYEFNNPDVDVWSADIRHLDLSQQLNKFSSVIGVMGGPPCQGFSESNRRTRTVSNPQNHLHKEFFRIVAQVQPRFFLLENVAGVKTLASGSILKEIIDSGKRLGYATSWKILDAAEFGVPQHRRRLFIVGSKGFDFSFPEPEYGPQKRRLVSAGEAISDLPILRNGAAVDLRKYRKPFTLCTNYQRLMRHLRPSARYVQGNLVSKNAPTVVKRYTYIKQGQNWLSIPARLMKNYKDVARCHTGIYYRLKAELPAKVIGNFRKNMLIHPTQSRNISVREAARLQSFPDWFVFRGSIGFQQQQVANAVPPLLAKAVAHRLLDCSRHAE